jgi:aspartyl-tRNA(Asn)/glutamyl-tRNA(Gln) amidotransferase subunit A
MQDEIPFASLSELSRLLESKEISPVELTEMYLDRTERLDRPDFDLPSDPGTESNGKLSSILTLAREPAIEAARRAEREIARGEKRGPLRGIPYGVKDILDTRGVRTTWGSRILADNAPSRDATVVAKLASAGAVLMAKMAMGEFAGGNTSNARNPWKLDRTTFGSSSGTAVGVVAGLIGFGVGSETGGSIVYPCSAVGATGLRPTFGRVSRHGCMALSWSLDKIGPLGRSAEDCGFVLEAIAGHDPEDVSTSRRSFRFQREPGSLRGHRVGVERAAFELAKPGDRAVFEQALDVLRRAGLDLEDIELPERPYGRLFSQIVGCESGSVFAPLFEDGSLASVFPYNRARVASWMAARMAPASDYLLAQRIRRLIVREADELLSRYRFVLAPTWPSGAALREVREGWPIPSDPEMSPGGTTHSRLKAHNLANLAGLPGISFPCGFDSDGMPLSLQLIAPAWEEQSLLDAATVFQRETDWHRRRPPEPFRA